MSREDNTGGAQGAPRAPGAVAPGHLPSEALMLRLAPLGPVPLRSDLQAYQAQDVFALWQAWEEESGEKQDVPFWATVWPAARLLAQYLGRAGLSLEGRNVLDLGCGGGVAGIAAAKTGAHVIANDIDPAALEMAERNAAANQVELTLAAGDLLSGACPDSIHLILAGDLFYEKSVSQTMLAWLRQARGRGIQVLIADASRPFAPNTGLQVLAEEKMRTNFDLEGAEERQVRLFSLEA